MHEVKTTIVEEIDYPDHAKRTTSEEFHKNRKMFLDREDGCWICGSHDNLEIHHLIEWSLFPAIDTAKMQQVLKMLDHYGFSVADNSPIKSPDDKRNLLVLCENHHRGRNNGIHALTYPVWLAQKCTKDGIDITPQVNVIQESDKKETK